MKMKVAFVLALVALVMMFVVPETHADYPYGFDKIKEICERSEEIVPGMKGVELVVPDTAAGNPGGTITLLAASGPHTIAVGIVIRTSEDDPVVATAIIHSHADGKNVVIDLLTQTEYPIEGRTIGLFITEWIRLYNQAVGTIV